MVARRRTLALMLFSVLFAATLAGCVKETPTPPSRVDNLRVDQEPGGARLTWDEYPLGQAAGFRVYKNGKAYANVTAPARTYLDDKVKPDETVRYTVRAFNREGQLGNRSNLVDFTLRQSLTLVQEERYVNRGFVNLTVAEVTAGLRWDQLVVTLDGKSLQRNDAAYTQSRDAWTHETPRDPLVDLGERMRLHSGTDVVRNATIEVKVAGTSKLLVRQLLAGRPGINLTLQQERNVTQGLASFVVRDVALHDGSRDVSRSYPDVVPRWSALEVRVNGTYVPYFADGRANSWSHDAPADDVIRDLGRLSLRLSPDVLRPGAVVVVRDAETNEESYRRVVT